jgi:hypothetical protein
VPHDLDHRVHVALARSLVRPQSVQGPNVPGPLVAMLQARERERRPRPSGSLGKKRAVSKGWGGDRPDDRLTGSRRSESPHSRDWFYSGFYSAHTRADEGGASDLARRSLTRRIALRRQADPFDSGARPGVRREDSAKASQTSSANSRNRSLKLRLSSLRHAVWRRSHRWSVRYRTPARTREVGSAALSQIGQS